MIKVLFVCTGNICRSPMAEAFFQDLVNKARLSDKIAADSAGTGNWHVGETAHSGTLAILKQRNIPYEGRARQLTLRDLDEFDYVVAMDRTHLDWLQQRARGSNAEIRLFLDYARDAGKLSEEEVPDPYYTGEFDLVYRLVSVGGQALLDHIRARHNL